MFRRVRGLVESVDTRVAESAKKLWLEELPASHKHGTNQHSEDGEEGEDKSNSTPNNRTQFGLLARLKRDHPDLAQQVIDGGHKRYQSSTRSRNHYPNRPPWQARSTV